MKKQERIFVIGHKNPDTDSICSAIAYADIKNRILIGQRILGIKIRILQFLQEVVIL